MPIDPQALGTDFYCEDDITDDFAYEEDPTRAYVQACYRRIVLLSLFYADPYGAGIFRFVLDTDTGATAQDDIRSAVVTALMLDERTQNVDVSFPNGKIVIQVTPSDAPSFSFTLPIDQVSGAIEVS